MIVAPFSGIVGLRNISVGALVEPGDVVTTLDDDSIMKLDFTVPAIYLATLRTGLPIVAKSPSFADRQFGGTVASINSRIDPSTRSIIVRAIIPNSLQIRFAAHRSGIVMPSADDCKIEAYDTQSL